MFARRFKIYSIVKIGLTAIILVIFFFQGQDTQAQLFETTGVVDYVGRVYWFGTAIVSSLAVVVIVIAGVNYMRSLGNPEQITRSKQLISGALIGLFLVLGGYFLLKIIDPRLVQLNVEVPELVVPEGAEGNCEDAVGKKCSFAQTPASTCKFSFWMCNSAWFGTDKDYKDSIILNMVCDTVTNTWKVANNELCGVDQGSRGKFYTGSDNPYDRLACDSCDNGNGTYAEAGDVHTDWCVTGTKCYYTYKHDVGKDLCDDFEGPLGSDRRPGWSYRCLLNEPSKPSWF